jgi:formylglycine-generating enzyme required for sulfatase activity
MTFHSRGALSPTSPLFRGRTAELARLVDLCQQDVSAYVIVYGGRQTGKTSLLLQLERQLHRSGRVCRVDFQGLPGADAPRMYRFLAQRIAAILPLTPDSDGVTDPPSLVQFLTQALSTADVSRLVVLMDELGTLPDTTRDELGNVLRSLFHTRLITPVLAKLQIVLTGGIELHNLVVAEVSALHNICEEIYLGDLEEAEAVALVADGLEPLPVARAEGEQVGRAVYAWVEGHPYLTQRLGHLLAEAHQRGAAIDTAQLHKAIDTVHRDDVLLRHLRGKLIEHQLQEIARQLLTESPCFSRLSDEMVRLELLGLAKGVCGQWAVRNPLIETVLREWLRMEPMQPLQVPPIPLPPPEPTKPESTPTSTTSKLQPAPDPAPESPSQSPAITVVEIAPGVTMEFVEVPAGPFLMGSSDDPNARDDEKPQHCLELPTYWIGKTPVTNAQFRPFVESDGYRNQYYWLDDGWRWREQKNRTQPPCWNQKRWNGADYPVVDVTWYESMAYCRWLSVQTRNEIRLPTEAEWEKAARGSDGLIWPWGNRWEVGRCNSSEDRKRCTTPVNYYLNGASPYGALDIAGNVWEWTCSKGDDYPYNPNDGREDLRDPAKKFFILRSGSWADDRTLVRCTTRSRDLPNTVDNLKSYGIRVLISSLSFTNQNE